MHVAVPLRRPKEVLSVGKEVEIVSQVHPGGVRLGKDVGGRPRPPVGKIQRQIRLQTRHGLKTETAAVRQPFGADDVFERSILYLNPSGAAGAFDFRDAQPHARVGAARPRVALSYHTRRKGADVHQVGEVDPRFVRLKISNSFRVGRPPVADVAAPEDLFPVHPRERAVEQRLRTVVRDPNLPVRVEVEKIKVVVAHVSDATSVWGEASGALFGGRRSQTAEARAGKFQYENVSVETVERPPARAVEGQRPRQRLRTRPADGGFESRQGTHRVYDCPSLSVRRVQSFERSLTRRPAVVEQHKSPVVQPRGRGHARDGAAFRAEDPFESQPSSSGLGLGRYAKRRQDDNR